MRVHWSQPLGILPVSRSRQCVAFGVLSLALLLLVGCQVGGGRTAPASVTPPPVPSFSPFNVATPGALARGAPAIHPHLGVVPAFTTQDMARYVTNHPLPGTSGAPKITRNAFLPSRDVALRTGASVGRAAATLVGYVELQGSYAFPNLQGGAPIIYSAAYEVFDAQTGNLLEYGGLRPTPAPTPTPIPTPTATASATPAAPQLSVSPPGTSNITCGSLPLTYPTVTVRNSGGRILTWQVMATNIHVTITPASGSLSAEQSQALSVTQTSGGAGADLTFESNAGSMTISFVCIPG